jgi:exportin-7
MSLTDARLSQGGCEKLEIAIMSFLEHVRKIYINEHTQKFKVYKRLSEVLGLNDESMLLSVISRKMQVLSDRMNRERRINDSFI